MKLKEICSYSPNVDYSPHEEELISNVIHNGKPVNEKVQKILENLGFSEFNAYSTQTHVAVVHKDGPTLFEIHDYH